MSDRKAIKCICMILPISEEEVEQEDHQLCTPHNWHDVAATIIKKYGTTYIDDINMDKEDY
jgi:hypothetical protein